MPAPSALYFDLGSPYAYLTFARVARVLGARPPLVPIVLGPVFEHRGFGSWSLTDTRAENMAEVERRALAYGLPPMVWPEPWPYNTLHAMRMATWAATQGRGAEFAAAAYRATFAAGADLRDHAVLAHCAEEAGLPGADVAAIVADQAIKDALRAATDAAIAAGVVGVPTIVVDGALFFGDDRLEAVAQAAG